MRLRWDWAWKQFLDPKEPHCKWFLKYILGEQYADLRLEMATLIPLGEETHGVNVSRYIADRYMQFTIDEEKGVIHLEFQSAPDDHICLRMLRYGLPYATEYIDTNCEHYTLPTTVLVNVRNTGRKSVDSRVLRLTLGRESCTLTYPIVEGWQRVPGLYEVMSASTCEQRDVAIGKFIRQFPYRDSVQRDNLISACILISEADAYLDRGLSEGSVDMARDEVKRTWKTIGEVMDEEYAEERARQTQDDMIKRMSKCYGIPIEKLRKDLGLDSKTGGKPSGLNHMSLN